ncbi:DNA polymerase I [Helicobacter sp. MIT 14-3879]|uniref:DNA polymerase I n=1 Tax=Helicobacter sp. MIT 14-3879 TaxID=2040649 RepID=UPI000E1F2FBC|nr:DNA polymerase I [Helicobacter sp. MIT 14-3879]RDU63499.1 DNA polymerase I [Helicobacter sp. MIT 14-3879]
MKTLSIIDTFGYFFRNFYALPKLRSKDGFPTGVLVGFINLINQLYNDSSDYLVFALEGGGDSIRKQLYPQYKTNRQEIDQDLLKQINVAISWIKKMNLSYISIDGYEADDAIASLSFLMKKQNIDVRIVSIDKDLYQLIDDNTYIYNPIKKKIIKENECFEKFGVYPKQFVDYQSLVGDSSDNIQGINGIGAKTSQILIQNFNSLDGIYENIDNLNKFLSPKMLSKIIEGKEDAYLSKKLVSLRNDLLDNFDLDASKKTENNPLLLIQDELQRYDIKLKSSIPSIKTIEKKTINAHFKSILDSKELLEIIDSIPKNSIVAFDTETNSLDSNNANIVGFSFCSSLDYAYYVPIAHNYLGVCNQISIKDAKLALEKLFTHHIIGHNIKFDIQVICHNFNLCITSYSDTMILAWLEDSSSPCNLDYCSKTKLNYETIKFSDIVPKNGTFDMVNIDIATKYAAEDSFCTFALYNYFIENLDSKMLNTAKKLEFPIINILANMEKKGIGVDINFFHLLKKELKEKIDFLSKEIYKEVGCEFNINSTKQLGEILFENLKLKKGRSLKSSGYSTDEKTLESLKDSHNIIPLLLEYRELSKLLNTYIIPILNLNKNNRIHTSFLQTGTSTGRLSSKSPNLQNIPVKTEIGRKIRKGFVAKDGYQFISADYSQIELRLLAHFSMDSSLVNAFKENKDIHLETAIKLFGNNAKEKRNIAKSINFGLIYGMGARKLAQTLGITQSQAKEYIDSYFKSFPTVKEFLNIKEKEILENGYSTTLLGRHRYFNFKNIADYEKMAFLREGINSIFQGSAADLIKLAMIECDREFKSMDINLLLQIHDELIFEVKEEEIENISKKISDIMSSVYTLNIPLKCGINIGKNWYLLK